MSAMKAAREYEPAMKGGDFVPDDFMYGAAVSSCAPDIRAGFLRKVYGLLSCQLLATVVVSCWFMFHEPTRFFVTHNQPMRFLTLIATFGFLFAAHAYKHSHPLNLGLLAGFTLTIAYSVGSTCALFQANGMGNIVLQAFFLTALTTMGLTAYTLRSKQDFSFMGAGLMAGLFALIVGGLVEAIVFLVTGVMSPVVSLALGVVGAVIFSGFMCAPPAGALAAWCTLTLPCCTCDGSPRAEFTIPTSCRRA